MYLYNSATHKKEEFVPYDPKLVKMYTCGPTVYHFAHIGNLRSYIMEDVLEKYLRYVGLSREARHEHHGCRPSDTPTQMRARTRCSRVPSREHKTVMEIAQVLHRRVLRGLPQAQHQEARTSFSPPQAALTNISRSLPSSLTPATPISSGGNVYFDTSKLEKYYIFNEHKEEDLAVGVREGVEEDTNKRNKNDFVLWFTKSKFEDQALKWDSPWGTSATPAGTSNAPAYRSNIWANTLTSTAAASTTLSRTTPTK